MDIIFSKKLDKELLEVGIDPFDVPIGDYKSVDDVLNMLEIVKNLENNNTEFTSWEESDWDYADFSVSDDEIYINSLYSNGELKDLKNFAIELLEDREKLREQLQNEEPQDDDADVFYIDDIDMKTELSKNKEFNVTIPSHSSFLLDNKFNYSLLSMLLKESIKDKDTNNRIVYKIDASGVSIIKRICFKYKLSYNTVNNGIKKFIQSGVISDIGKFYMFNIKVDNKYFIEIHSTILDKIYNYKLEHKLSVGDKRRITIDSMLRCLVFMSYKLKSGPVSNMSRAYICEAIGLVNRKDGKPTKEHTDKLTCNLRALASIGAITIFTRTEKKDVNGNILYNKNNTYALGKVILRK